jgi:hypothetical protein
MPASLLDSQLQILEPEGCHFHFTANETPDDIVDMVLDASAGGWLNDHCKFTCSATGKFI